MKTLAVVLGGLAVVSGATVFFIWRKRSWHPIDGLVAAAAIVLVNLAGWLALGAGADQERLRASLFAQTVKVYRETLDLTSSVKTLMLTPRGGVLQPRDSSDKIIADYGDYRNSLNGLAQLVRVWDRAVLTGTLDTGLISSERIQTHDDLLNSIRARTLTLYRHTRSSIGGWPISAAGPSGLREIPASRVRTGSSHCPRCSDRSDMIGSSSPQGPSHHDDRVPSSGFALVSRCARRADVRTAPRMECDPCRSAHAHRRAHRLWQDPRGLSDVDRRSRPGRPRIAVAPDAVRVVYVSPLKALSADIHKNLAEPRRALRKLAEETGLDIPRITAAVRTGDTTSSERAAMLRTPPHILVTTPESLYLLLTAERSRQMLQTARTVIVDEIHAVIGTRRGAHLALTLERLEALCEEEQGGSRRLQRIGLSATQKPIDEVARFLVGASDDRGGCTIIDEGHRREIDLAVEIPQSPLDAVMSHEVWEEYYDRLAALIGEHRTTLVFVNTRRMAERVARHLSDRIGEDAVTAHHGSLSKERRLDAEHRLKSGALKALVATASLELGIDIGHVDLVCQIGSPHRIATLLQRVGRSGHTISGTPKGRMLPVSLDDLVECAALLRASRRGDLDCIVTHDAPLDVLAQQITAETSCHAYGEDELHALVRRAWPYRDLTR